MKAVVQEGYGTIGALQLREIAQPVPGNDDVLVEVHAASVNALDWHVLRGVPFIIPLLEVVTSRGPRVRGVDLAGRVAAVGKNVTRIAPGDEVFGGADGSFAELVVTKESRIARKPAGVSFEQAATLNVAGLTALQGLRDRAGVRPGQHVLVNGAGGGVGTFAVQIAKWLGARVTAVTRATSFERVSALGADDVIDHGVEDFTTGDRRYDVIFDIGGAQPLLRCRRVLTDDGILVAIGGPQGRWLAPADRLLKAIALNIVSGRKRIKPFVSAADTEALALLAELVVRGVIAPVIERSYPLSETAEAVRRVGTGEPQGKVVIKVR